MTGEFYEDPSEAKRRIEGTTRPDRPSHNEVVESCRELLYKGADPTTAGQKTADCPECGYEMVVGRKTHGPDVTGIRETVALVADLYEGNLSGDEFRECVEDAVQEALQDLDDEDMTAEVHVTLQEFEDDEEDA